MARKTDIRLRRSNTAGATPSGSHLNEGELAINTADGALYFKKSDSTVITAHDNTIMHIDSQNDRVGIGTTNPSSTFQVEGTGDYLANFKSSDAASGIKLTDSSSQSRVVNIAGHLVLLADANNNSSNSTIRFNIDTASVAASDSSMILTSTGLGIGTSSPNTQLHIENTSHAVAKLQAGTDSSASLRLRNDVQDWDVNLQTNDKFAIYDHTSTTQPFTIMPTTGNVGINNITPLQKFSVNGVINSDSDQDYYGAWMQGNTATGGRSQIAVGEWYSSALYMRKKTGEGHTAIYNYNQGHPIAIAAGSGNYGDTAITGTSGRVGIGTHIPNSKVDIRQPADGIILELINTLGNADDTVDIKMVAGNPSAGTYGTILRHERQGTSGGDFAILTNPLLSGAPVERFRITKDGFVGIGTSAPAGNLHIKSIGNIGDAKLIIEADADNNIESDNPRIELRQDNNLVSGSLYLEGVAGTTATNTIDNALVLDSKGAISNQAIQFATGGRAAAQSGGESNSNVAMTILGSGSRNVGIGTTTPSAALHIASTTANATGIGFQNSSRYYAIEVEGGGLRVKDVSAGLVERFRIASDGRVGIGTNSPSTNLTVVQSGVMPTSGFSNTQWVGAFVNTATTTSIARVGIYSGNNTDALLNFGDADDADIGGLSYSNAENSLAIRTNNAEHMRIKADGKVGIGTSTPAFKLHVVHTTTPVAKFEGSTNAYMDFSDGTVLTRIQNSGGLFIGTQTNHNLSFKTNGSVKMTVRANGHVGIGQSTPRDLLDIVSSTSDARLILDAAEGFDPELKFFEAGSVKFTVGHDAATSKFVIGTSNVDTQKRFTINTSGAITFNEAYTFPTSIGAAGQILKVPATGTTLVWGADAGGGSANLLTDGDGDTLIQVEEGTDEDIIRFDVAGSEVAQMTDDGVVLNDGYNFEGDVIGAIKFKAQAGEALTKGDTVYISGISGNTTIVSKADANDAAKMPAFGLAASTVSLNAAVQIVTFGTLQGIDTSSYSEGDELYVNVLAGTLTDSAPTGSSAALQKIAKVTRSDASAGSVKVSGAGRTNATPNLDEGKIFVGNSSNKSVQGDDTLHVDMANSRVGINTTSPAGTLHVSDGVGAGLEVNPQTANDRVILFAYDRSASAYQSMDFDATDFHFNPGGTEKARITSAGALFVGSTSDTGTGYHYIKEDGFVRHKRAGSVVGIFDRGTNDGEVILIRKDGATTGRIGTESGRLVLGTGNTGLGFIDVGQDRIIPRLSTGGNANASIDLGDGASQFKDLYLSGYARVSTQVRLNKQGTADVNNQEYDSASLVFQANAWDTNGSIARDVNWTVKNETTASVYPDSDLKFYEPDNGLVFELHGRGTSGHVDPKAGTFYGNVAINAGSGSNAGAGNLTIAGDLTVNGTTVTNSASNTTIEDALIELGSGNTGANSNDLGFIFERGTTGDNVFFGFDESEDEVAIGYTTATGASTGGITRNSFTNFRAGQIQSGNTSIQGLIRVHHGDGAYLDVNGNGLTFNRSINYLKPSTDGNKLLYLGDTGTSSDWKKIIVKTVDGLSLEQGDLTVNTDTLKVDTTNSRVGVGTATPTVLLDVNIDGNTTRFSRGATQRIEVSANSGAQSILSTSGTNKTFMIGTTDANQLRLQTNGSYAIAIDNSQRVGIGTTTPNAPLEIHGADIATGATTTASSVLRLVRDVVDPTHTLRKDSAVDFMLSRQQAVANNLPYTRLDIRLSGTTDTSSPTLDVMSLLHNGNVGIGITSPQELLHLESTEPLIRLDDTNSGLHYIFGQDGDSFKFTTNNSTFGKYTFDSNVGIGTTNPKAKLQVEEYAIDTTETSTTATTQVAIHTFPIADFRSARFTIQVTNSTDSTYHTTEILVIHDGTTAYMTEFGEIHTGSAEEAVFDTDILSNNMRLLATPASTDAMEFKVVCHSITV